MNTADMAMAMKTGKNIKNNTCKNLLYPFS